MNTTNITSYNSIIDISKASSYFLNYYMSIKQCLFTYVTCLLFKSVEYRNVFLSNRKISDVIKVEDGYYDALFADLVSGRLDYVNVMNQVMTECEFPSHKVPAILDDVHDAVQSQCSNLIQSIQKNPKLYLDKVALVSFTVISERVMLLSFKLINIR